MTCRAILWCGYIEPRRPTEEAAIFRHDIELAIRAAHARGVPPDEIHALVCDRALLPDDFRGHWHRADWQSFQRIMGKLAQIATTQDACLFIAINHGDRDGLLIEREPASEFDDGSVIDTPEFLSPGLLARFLDAIEGQQIAIVATCHAGVFLAIESSCRMVCAACDENQPLRWNIHEQHPPRNPFLYELLSHWGGVSLADYDAPTRCSLDDAFRAIASEFPGSAIRGRASWPDPEPAP